MAALHDAGVLSDGAYTAALARLSGRVAATEPLPVLSPQPPAQPVATTHLPPPTPVTRSAGRTAAITVASMVALMAVAVGAFIAVDQLRGSEQEVALVGDPTASGEPAGQATRDVVMSAPAGEPATSEEAASAVVDVPSVVGQPLSAASQTLASAGLSLEIVTRPAAAGEDDGQVVGMLPRPGSPVEAGTTIRITVAQTEADDTSTSTQVVVVPAPAPAPAAPPPAPAPAPPPPASFGDPSTVEGLPAALGGGWVVVLVNIDKADGLGALYDAYDAMVARFGAGRVAVIDTDRIDFTNGPATTRGYWAVVADGFGSFDAASAQSRAWEGGGLQPYPRGVLVWH